MSKRNNNVRHTPPPLLFFKMLKNILWGRGCAHGAGVQCTTQRVQYRGSVSHWLRTKKLFSMCAGQGVRMCAAGIKEIYLINLQGTVKERCARAMNRDRKSTRLNSSHTDISRMPSSA